MSSLVSGDATLSESWDGAPCGLLDLDADGLVRSANARLLERLGYARDAVVDRLSWDDLLTVGSRVFWHTQLVAMLELHGALEEVMVDLRAADGRRLPVLLNAVRATSSASPGLRIAVMNVPDRRAYENELREARAAAERAGAADLQTRLRLELLARASVALASSIDIGVALARLARVLTVELADWILIYAVDPEHREDAPRWSASHASAAADPDKQAVLERLAVLLPEQTNPQSNFRRALENLEPMLVPHVSAEQQRASTSSSELLDLYAQLDAGSVILVPSAARGALTAVMVLVRGAGRPAFTDDDLADLTDLAARTGIVIDNLRQRAREHSNSVALQQALLTSPPPTPGLEITTRYLPATSGNTIGGDWYDAFPQADGTPVLVIGDVVGHDIKAAAAMGQLRGVMRAIGFPQGITSPDILTVTDETARGLGVAVLASAFLGRVTRDASGVALRWSNAGHPPPLVMDAAGSVRRVEAHPDPILGLRGTWARHEHVTSLAVGDTLLLYTDGLVERPDEDLDDGIDRLAAAFARGYQLSLDEQCELILTDHQTGRRDDIALLVVRVLD